MIRWCCYCQRLMKEKPPFTDYRITHSICEPCEVRLDADEPLHDTFATLNRFYQELFSAATTGDPRSARAMARNATALGLACPEVLLGLVQSALVEIGERWERGEVTVVDEHRFTAWCEAMLHALDWPAAPEGDLDLLIFQAPGNRHDLGPRIAEQVLLAKGVRVEAVAPDLPLREVSRLAREREVSWVGFSCALPHMVEASLQLAGQLLDDGYSGGVILSGQALRRSPDGWGQGSAVVCLTVEDACELILEGREAYFRHRSTPRPQAH